MSFAPQVWHYYGGSHGLKDRDVDLGQKARWFDPLDRTVNVWGVRGVKEQHPWHMCARVFTAWTGRMLRRIFPRGLTQYPQIITGPLCSSHVAEIHHNRAMTKTANGQQCLSSAPQNSSLITSTVLISRSRKNIQTRIVFLAAHSRNTELWRVTNKSGRFWSFWPEKCTRSNRECNHCKIFFSFVLSTP